jgi:LysM repeat protein
MVARKPLFRKILSFKGNGMTSQKDKYKEATSFFGVERMAQLESAIKEQNIKSNKKQFKKALVKNLKMAGVLVLVGYSAGLTYLMMQKAKSPITSPLLISKNEFSTSNINDATVTLQPKSTDIVTKPKSLVKLKVKKGDSLSSIAQNIIRSNGAKNTYENRKIIMEELKNKNGLIQDDQPIKSGWTLLSLSKTETLEICKN